MAAADETLLKLMTESELPRHVLRASDGSTGPMYKLQRCPVSINEFSNYERNTILWMENGTMVLLNFFPSYSREHPNMNKPHIQLLFNHDNKEDMISFLIRGKCKESVAETATFLWDLKHERTNKSASVFIGANHRRMDMGIFQTDQFARLFDANPTRHIIFHHCTLPAEIAGVLLVRPHLVDLVLNYSKFSDDGIAFLSSIGHRQSSFGALALEESVLEESEMRVLFQHLHLFTRLELPSLPGDLFLQAITSPVESISLNVDFTKHDLSRIDFSSIDIVAEEVGLNVGVCDHVEYPTAFVVAFLRRVAQLGHFQALALRHDHPLFTKVMPEEVGKELLKALAANPQLRVLDLGREVFYSEEFWGPLNPVDNYVHWGAHLKDLLHLMEDHAALKTFKIPSYPTEQDAEYSWLRQLLRRNRNIRVIDRFEKLVTDGASIDQQYALNRFACCHEPLKGEPPSLRPTLIGTALIECAAAHIPRTASLLLRHTDVLCDLLHDAQAVDTPAEQFIL